jgi:hypothetical protein
MFLFAERIGVEVFISRHRFEEVDEGLVFRGGTTVLDICDGQGDAFMGTGRSRDF